LKKLYSVHDSRPTLRTFDRRFHFTLGAFFNSRRDQLVARAAQYLVATVYPWREAAMAGGLMSYGASIARADEVIE
jgi:hypothetical protein